MPAACKKEWPRAGCSHAGESRQLSLVWGCPSQPEGAARQGAATAARDTGRPLQACEAPRKSVLSLAAWLRTEPAATVCFCCGGAMQQVSGPDPENVVPSRQERGRTLRCRSCGAEVVHHRGEESREAAPERG